MTIPSKFEWRMLMRSYFIHEQPSINYGIDVRFIICKPSEKYTNVIQYENNTYGDIIALNGTGCVKENMHRGKLFEYYNYISSRPYLSETYKLVGKYDDDTFTNFQNLYNFIVSRRSNNIYNDSYWGPCCKGWINGTRSNSVGEAITYNNNHRTSFFIAGCCYVISMDVLKWITSNKSFAYYHRVMLAEDAATGLWLVADQKGLNTYCTGNQQVELDYNYCRDVKKFQYFCSWRNRNFVVNKTKMLHYHYVKTRNSWINISTLFWQNYKILNYTNYSKLVT